MASDEDSSLKEARDDDTIEETNVSDDDSCPDVSIQPRVPLHIDPEFVDPNQNKYKYGIIYLSYIPDGLNVRMLREIMSQFGEVGRIYLEPEEAEQKHRSYIEGWIEFKKKRVAKSVAKTLNGTTLRYGRKHCKFNGQVWSIKYLHRFKWAHLKEQLVHDKAVRDQKRKFEMSQAKKESDFYQKMTERSKMMKKQRNLDQNDRKKGNNFLPNQNKPTTSGDELKMAVDEELLTSIFKRVA